MSFGDSRNDYSWEGNFFKLGRKKIMEMIPDEFPGMWRLKLPSGKLSGPLNKSRAKELAYLVALGSKK